MSSNAQFWWQDDSHTDRFHDAEIAADEAKRRMAEMPAPAPVATRVEAVRVDPELTPTILVTVFYCLGCSADRSGLGPCRHCGCEAVIRDVEERPNPAWRPLPVLTPISTKVATFGPEIQALIGKDQR